MAISFEKWQRKKVTSPTWQICALCVFGYNLFMPVMKYIPLIFNRSAPQSWQSSERDHPHLRASQSTSVWNLKALCFSFFFFFINLAGNAARSECRWMFPTAAPPSFRVSRCLRHSRPTRSLQLAVGKTSSDFHRHPCLQQLGLRTKVVRFIIKATRAVSKAYKNATKLKQKLYKSWVCKGRQGWPYHLFAATISLISSCQ